MPRAGIPELLSDVANEALDLISTEVTRARLELDERTAHAARLLLRLGIAMTFGAVALQAFSMALIIWSARLFDGSYLVGAVVLGSVFSALALVVGLAVRRAALLTKDPTSFPERAPRALPEPSPQEKTK